MRKSKPGWPRPRPTCASTRSCAGARLDEAADAARDADRALARLRTELADVPDASAPLPELNIDGLTRFVDIWLDNIFTDLSVRSRINAAKQKVGGAVSRVDQLLVSLDSRRADTTEKLAAIAAERVRVLE